MQSITGFDSVTSDNCKTMAECLFEDSNKTIVLTEDCYTLDVRNDVTIEAGIPIEVNGVEIAVIKGSGALYLKATEFMQPCIGSRTYTGMSYDRWTPNCCKCKKIIVDGVHVVCESITPNFTIGAYNFEEYPEIICLNGGELLCVETSAKRILKTKAYPPDGSTKISTVAEYVLEGQELFSAGQKKLISEINKVTSVWKDRISFKTTPQFLEAALKLLQMNPDCNVDMLVNGKYQKSVMICRTMCMLDMPEVLYDWREIEFECNKLAFLERKYQFDIPDDEDVALGVCKLVHRVFGDDFSKLTDWQIEQVYEMIPSYFFTFEYRVSNRVNAEKFFNMTKENLT